MLHSEYLPPLTSWQPETLGVLSHIYTQLPYYVLRETGLIWVHCSLRFFAKTARFPYLCQLAWSISPATVIRLSPNFVRRSAHYWYISVQNISLICGGISTQLLVLQPSKSGALGKSIKQPKQIPEVLMQIRKVTRTNRTGTWARKVATKRRHKQRRNRGESASLWPWGHGESSG